MNAKQPEHPTHGNRLGGSPLRIVICLSQFHPAVGGAERQLLQLARHWAAWGHTVRVITRPVKGMPRREVLDRVDIRRSLYTFSLGPLFGVTFVACLVAQLLRLALSCDVVLAAQAPWEAVATGLFRRLTGKPTAVRLANAGHYGDLRQLQRAKGRRILSWLFKSNRLFLALSNQSREELAELGCPTENIAQLTNGVDTGRFIPPQSTNMLRDRTVLFVARLTEQKNPLSLLRSWQRVPADRGYRLLIAGDGPLAAQIEKTITQLQLQNVELLGLCHDLLPLYHQASVFVLPSRSEGCSNALLEAMAAGLCPVVTNIGGNRDVITDRVDGLLVEPDDDEQLGDVLTDVLADTEMREQLAAAARARVVAHHDADFVAHRYLDELARIVE